MIIIDISKCTKNAKRRDTEQAKEKLMDNKCNELKRMEAEGKYDQMYKQRRNSC